MEARIKNGFIKLGALRKGSKIRVVSLSSGLPHVFPNRFEVGCDQLSKEFDLEVTISENALREPAWLYRNPEARADDFISALEDPSVEAIISSIGGEDSIRINKYISPDLIKRNPKIFLGYSDSTCTHMLFNQAKVVSFYGPSIMTAFAENGGIIPHFSRSVRDSLFNSEVKEEDFPNLDGWTNERLDWSIAENQQVKRVMQSPLMPHLLQGKGSVRGHLLGGCIEVLNMLRGTEYWPDLTDFNGAILFLENSTEEFLPIELERTIRSYGCMGILERLTGIIIGRPGGNLTVDRFLLYSRAVQKVVATEFGLVDLPILAQLDFGHTDPVSILPYGAQAEIDCEKATFRVVEKVVY